MQDDVENGIFDQEEEIRNLIKVKETRIGRDYNPKKMVYQSPQYGV